ncbi:MAG: helix-turn-helix domain-containing protein [Armatimonadetes bacterium]|nr:helix-turn-helix domain-containing protein [Armatimonadota bacterium]
MSSEEAVIRGTGNVFADLGLPDPEEHLLKAEIVVNLQALLQQRGLDGRGAAERLGLDEPELDALLRGQFIHYPVERLLRMVNALGSDVKIVITTEETRQEKASLSVVTA